MHVLPTSSRASSVRSARDVQPLLRLLERNSSFARLAPRVEQMTALATDLNGLLPDYLAPNISSGPIREGVLTVFATHGALAARLRHLEPRLTQDLQRRGWAIHALRIRIYPHTAIAQLAPKAVCISPAGLASLHALHERLAPSPLRVALAHLLARHRSI